VYNGSGWGTDCVGDRDVIVRRRAKPARPWPPMGCRW
jgi:hypothetical protein